MYGVYYHSAPIIQGVYFYLLIITIAMKVTKISA